ncbi:hypothetical protein [Candidatus Synechococcus spongiarum]|uniref:Uncharacterized protein n=1 Tax=Candidatus Synechococcus spongiarum LMB bulk15N TaxID=1943583 RepID=A0A1T1D6S0_9SYNE|nr:hypothetical protein [Candidatus Synechococcus spongiarum]OOV36554.1 hypothetical protein BV53_00330 [Candidatus Synechococcus spongiarum LMB bulk15N]
MISPPLHPVALIAAWSQPEMLIPFGGLLIAFAGLLLTACQFLKGEIKGSETRLREEMKAGDTRLWEEMKAGEARLSEEMKAGEARQREALLDVKGEVRSLGDKLDSLLVLMAKETAVPTVGHDR